MEMCSKHTNSTLLCVRSSSFSLMLDETCEQTLVFGGIRHILSNIDTSPQVTQDQRVGFLVM